MNECEGHILNNHTCLECERVYVQCNRCYKVIVNCKCKNNATAF